MHVTGRVSSAYGRMLAAVLLPVSVATLALGAPALAASDTNAAVGGSGFSAFIVDAGKLKILRADAVSARRLVDRGYNVAPVHTIRMLERAPYVDPAYAPVLPDVEATGSIVAVIDTGLDATHPWFEDRVVAATATTGTDSSNWQDEQGHGTHVAGVVLQADPSARIMPVRVLDRFGSGSDADIALGIVWAVEHGASVINLSLGAPDNSAVLEQAIDYARTSDVAVVAAAGNDGKYGSPVFYPAASEGVIAVAALTGNGRAADFSNRGFYVDIAAPGVDVVSSVRGGKFQAMSGTSMAAPYVAGVLASLRQKHPNADAASIAQHAQNTSVDLGVPGRDDIYGWGAVDKDAALSVPLTDAPSESPSPRTELLPAPVFHTQSMPGAVLLVPVQELGPSKVYVDGDLALTTEAGQMQWRVPLLGHGLVQVYATALDGSPLRPWWGTVQAGKIERPRIEIDSAGAERLKLTISLPRAAGTLVLQTLDRTGVHDSGMTRPGHKRRLVRVIPARREANLWLLGLRVCLDIGNEQRPLLRCSAPVWTDRAPSWLRS